MRVLLPKECDQLLRDERGDLLERIAQRYVLFVQARIDITVNQFREHFELNPHPDSRGDSSILDDIDADVHLPEDKVVK